MQWLKPNNFLRFLQCFFLLLLDLIRVFSFFNLSFLTNYTYDTTAFHTQSFRYLCILQYFLLQVVFFCLNWMGQTYWLPIVLLFLTSSFIWNIIIIIIQLAALDILAFTNSIQIYICCMASDYVLFSLQLSKIFGRHSCVPVWLLRL